MNITTDTTLLSDIISLAKSNDRHISYTVIVDMLKDNDSEIQKNELDRIVRQLSQEGYIIDTETVDESYDEDEVSGKSGFIPADVNIISQTFSLDRIVDRIRHDEIDLHPDFQRRSGLWDVKKQSRLIESLMLRIPLPAFYFDASNDDRWVIIDGLQRLTSIRNIILGSDVAKKSEKMATKETVQSPVEENGSEGTFLQLEGLEYLTDFNGKTFPELPRQYQRRILEAQITLYIVQKSTPEEIVYNIFKRINTGGLTLTPQEIRHALYRGKATELARELANTEEFKTATDHSIDSSRMLDCEYVIRYFAFTRMDIERDFIDNVDNNLNKTMKYLNGVDRDELLKEKSKFCEVMRTAYQIFDKYTFRKILNDGRRGPVNKAIFEMWCNCISKLNQNEREEIINHKEQIINRFQKMLNQEDFSGWIKSGKKGAIIQRIRAISEMVREELHADQTGDKKF